MSRTLAEISPMEAKLEQRLCDEIGNCRNAHTTFHYNRARREVDFTLQAINAHRFRGIGILSLIDDINRRGLGRRDMAE